MPSSTLKVESSNLSKLPVPSHSLECVQLLTKAHSLRMDHHSFSFAGALHIMSAVSISSLSSTLATFQAILRCRQSLIPYWEGKKKGQNGNRIALCWGIHPSTCAPQRKSNINSNSNIHDESQKLPRNQIAVQFQRCLNAHLLASSLRCFLKL